MHILLAALGLMGVAAFWWYRLKMMNDAAGEVADVLGRIQGQFRRKRLRRQAAVAPLTAIDDPVVAAATLITAIVSENVPMTPPREAGVRAVIAEIADAKKTEEALAYAKWAAAQIDDTEVVMDKLTPFLRDRLDPDERNDLLQMTRRALPADQDRPPLFDQRMRRLKQKFGFEIN